MAVLRLPFLVYRSAPSPGEVLGIQPVVEHASDDCGGKPVTKTTTDISPELSALQSVLDANYTLVYRQRKASDSERASLQSTAKGTKDLPTERSEGVGGDQDGTTAQENNPPTTLGAGPALGGIDLVLVERVGWASGKGPSGLLDEAMLILRDACGGNSGAVGRTC